MGVFPGVLCEFKYALSNSLFLSFSLSLSQRTWALRPCLGTTWHDNSLLSPVHLAVLLLQFQLFCLRLWNPDLFTVITIIWPCWSFMNIWTSWPCSIIISTRHSQKSTGYTSQPGSSLGSFLGFGLSREIFLATVHLHLHCLLFGVLGWVSVQHFDISNDVRRAINCKYIWFESQPKLPATWTVSSPALWPSPTGPWWSSHPWTLLYSPTHFAPCTIILELHIVLCTVCAL